MAERSSNSALFFLWLSQLITLCLRNCSVYGISYAVNVVNENLNVTGEMMNKFMRCFVVCIGLCGAGAVGVLDAQNFILPKQNVKQKKLSKNELKETLGQATKGAFNQTTELSRLLGSVQVEMATLEEQGTKNKILLPDITQVIAPLLKELGFFHVHLSQMQSRFAHLVEKLVENQKPFKKASRDQLQDALNVMNSIAEFLQKQENGVQSFSGRLNKITKDNAQGRLVAFQSIESMIKSDREQVQDLLKQLDQNDCLKNS